MKPLLLLAMLLLSACGQDFHAELHGEGEQSFSVLSYNVQSRPILDAARAKINLPIIGSRLNTYDIAGVQECFSHCDLLLDQTKHPHEHYFNGKKYWWSIANSGLAGVSRLPMLEVKTMFYENRAEIPDGVASKGILLMRYLVGQQILDVYSTHMQAGSSAPAQKAIMAQADEMIAFVQENSPPEHAVIIHGDFNMSPARPDKSWEDFSPKWYKDENQMLVRTATFTRLMESLGMTDVSDELLGPTLDYIDRFIYRSGTKLNLQALDWEDKDADFRDPEGEMLSDHPPVAARFGWSL